MTVISHQHLNEILDYNPESGEFHWKKSLSPRAKAGSLAGTINAHGYVVITIDRKLYSGQKLAWFYTHAVWPALEVDHRDGIRSNNAIANLRESTSSQNHLNCEAYRNNRSGVKNVSWCKAKSKWLVQLFKDGRVVFRRRFESLEDAELCSIEMRLRLHGEFAVEHREAA